MHYKHAMFKTALKFLTPILLLIIWLPFSHAQSLTLRLMESQTGSLNAENPNQIWTYNAANSTSTIVVETINGTLDPTLEILDENGAAIASNTDFAPAFSTAARLSLPAAETYVLRVSAAFGEGDYRITALPGGTQRQFVDIFAAPNPYWDISGARAVENGVQVGSLMIETHLYTPLDASPLSDVYLQARLRWGQTRADSIMGLVARGKTESNGQISGLRLELSPDGAWQMITNDISGAETVLGSGRLEQTENVTLGLLAQGELVAFFADGVELGEARDTTFTTQTEWGISAFDAEIILEEFWLATSALTPPDFPEHLENWESERSTDILTELTDAQIIPSTGKVQLTAPQTSYTINGIDQRNFLVSDESVIFDDAVIGADVRITEGEDVGCGLVAKFLDRQHKMMVYTDLQNGAGLLWWLGGELLLNNYTLLDNLDPEENRLLLILRDQFVVLYVNGNLTAQALIPRRMGNVGVGFINYAEGAASCQFNNLWVWAEK